MTLNSFIVASRNFESGKARKRSEFGSIQRFSEGVELAECREGFQALVDACKPLRAVLSSGGFLSPKSSSLIVRRFGQCPSKGMGFESPSRSNQGSL